MEVRRAGRKFLFNLCHAAAPMFLGASEALHEETEMSLALHCNLRSDPAIATTGDELWLRSRLGSHSHVGDIRGRGLFWALDFVEDRASRRGFNPDLRINDAALRRGIAIYPMGGTVDGTQGDHVIIAPPYIADAAAIDLIVDRLGDAVRDALGAG